MNSEQLKLIKQLAELGGITIVNRGTTSLVNAISVTDNKKLGLII